MKKRTISILLLMIVVLAIPTYATYQRAARVIPSITFSGTTATCTARIAADWDTDKISATIKLKHGSRQIASWNESASGILVFEDTVQVDKNRTYILEVTATINGETLPTATISRTNS